MALFLFGNIVAQNPSLALQRESTTTSPYWLAALDVLNAGDNSPPRRTVRTLTLHLLPTTAPEVEAPMIGAWQ
ncbi:MAG TPA: hypothetical protein VHX63_01585 [Acidobacteriaceae bacterium]|nr:hypothetical protein [Acidobacteriaceae bacterium]